MFPISDTNTSGRFPFWVFTLILANVLVFILELLSPDTDQFITQFALIPSQLSFSNPSNLTPLITSQFLHGGFLHILSNLWFLWIFGDNVEERLGPVFFPIFYLLAGVAGGLLQYSLDPTSNIPMIGASGSIAGVLGAYLVFFPDHRVKTLIPFFGFLAPINLPASLMLFYWFFTQLFNGSLSIVVATASMGGIAFFAHIGGFATGFIIANIYKRG